MATKLSIQNSLFRRRLRNGILLLVVSYSFIYLVPTDKLPFGLIFEKTAIVLLLLVYRLLLLGYVLVVCHMSFG